MPLLGSVVANRRLAKLTRELRASLAEAYCVDFTSAMGVGLAPGKVVSDYGGDTAWDLGFVIVSHKLEYFGDQTQFALSGCQVVKTKIRRPLKALFQPLLFIEYLQPGVEETSWMMLEVRPPATRRMQAIALQRLQTQIALLPKGSPEPNPQLVRCWSTPTLELALSG